MHNNVYDGLKIDIFFDILKWKIVFFLMAR